jgi:anti-anti-sigma regulatory factor
MRMQQTSSTPTAVVLEGDWTMNEAGARQEMLTGELARQLEANPGGAALCLDLSGITELDACGCQLLALFLETLKRHQLIGAPRGIRPGLLETVRLLGFADTLCAVEAAQGGRS